MIQRSRINILYLEQSKRATEWVQNTLKEQLERHFSLKHILTLKEGLEAIDKNSFDLVLSELMLDDSSGIDTFLALKERSTNLPIVIFTSVDDNELALTTVRQGAQDYLIKGKTDQFALARSINYAIERQQLQDKIRTRTLKDELTGLYNQRGFHALAHEYAALAERTKRSMLILFIDLDGLKKINDTLGHSEGDHAIVAASAVLERTFRATDLIARLGGDEFAALLMETEDQTEELVRDRLQAMLTRHNTQKRRDYDLKMSIGFSRFEPGSSRPIQELLKEADEAMYQDKRKRKAVRKD
ncbi:probable diguanylate cyclase DgcC [Ylistrum balloti]|uniref:probable diguanylate cyclase DgcC n=1 Tax=Ylistrum balloti TaxID=509963 RepID=UPI002905B135|nr:probable diguanylate cyclase DgcC [Ylistrum balloti]